VLSSGRESGNDGIYATYTRGTGDGPFYDGNLSGLFEHAGGNGLVLAEGGGGGRCLLECGRGGGSIPNVRYRHRRGLWLWFGCAHWFRNRHGLRCRRWGLPRAPRVKQGGERGVLKRGGGVVDGRGRVAERGSDGAKEGGLEDGKMKEGKAGKAGLGG